MTFPLRNIIFASMTLVLLVIVAIISPVSAQSVDTGASKAIERDSTLLSLASLKSMDAPSIITADPKAKVNFASPSITSKPKPKPKPVVKPAPAVVKPAPTPVDAQIDSSELGDAIAAPYSAPAAASSSITNISDIKQFARTTLASKGMGDGEFNCLTNLWEKESNWNFKAENASSGAYGIPQSLPGSKMASVSGDWQTNPKTQVIWGIGYIQERYQTPCGAWGHSVSVGWY